MADLVLRHHGNVCDLSMGGQDPVPPAILNLLRPSLTYTKLEHRYGWDAYNSVTGQRQAVDHVKQELFYIDDQGRMAFGQGVYPRILTTLLSAGHKPVYIDKRPPKPEGTYFQDWDRVNELFKFRPGQLECLYQVAIHDFGIIDATMAFGKSFLFPAVCVLFPNAKVHVTTTRADVTRMLRRKIMQYVPNVGQVGAGKKQLGRVTVFTAKSLHHSLGDADILLVDEAHEMMADQHAARLTRYRLSRTYGFSATTTGRGDGTDARMESVFGPTIYHMPYEKALDLGLVVPVNVRWLSAEFDNDPTKGYIDPTSKKRWGIWRNEERNQMLANAAREFEDEQVLIMVETVDHALHLQKHLPEFELCYAEGSMTAEKKQKYINMGLWDPNKVPLSKKDRMKLTADFEAGKVRKAISTGVWSTGVSFEELSVLIRGEGSNSRIADLQVPGRAIRLHANKTEALVIDSLDRFSPAYAAKAENRRREYAKQGWVNIMPDGKVWKGRNRRQTT